MQRNVTIVSLSAFVAASFCAALALAKMHAPSYEIGLHRIRKNTPQEDLIQQKHSQAFGEGVEAFRKGDLKTAEYSLVRATHLQADDDFSQSFLAQVYQLEGKNTLALKTYRSALSTPHGRFSTVTEDPRILAGFGDVCEKTGHLQEAQRAYVAAAYREDFARPKSPLRPLFGENLATLKRKAHASAAAECRSVGDRVGAERHLRLGIQSDPKSWEAHLALATVLRLEGKIEAATSSSIEAEKLAGKDASKVHEQRERMGLVNEMKYFGVVNGKMVQIPKPPSDKEALAKARAENKRSQAAAPPPRPENLRASLRTIRMLKAQFPNDLPRMKNLEKGERILNALLAKAESTASKKAAK